MTRVPPPRMPTSPVSRPEATLRSPTMNFLRGLHGVSCVSARAGVEHSIAAHGVEHEHVAEDRTILLRQYRAWDSRRVGRTGHGIARA
eukprot:222606-Rhodomonas_salina.1